MVNEILFLYVNSHAVTHNNNSQSYFFKIIFQLLNLIKNFPLKIFLLKEWYLQFSVRLHKNLLLSFYLKLKFFPKTQILLASLEFSSIYSKFNEFLE